MKLIHYWNSLKHSQSLSRSRKKQYVKLHIIFLPCQKLINSPPEYLYCSTNLYSCHLTKTTLQPKKFSHEPIKKNDRSFPSFSISREPRVTKIIAPREEFASREPRERARGDSCGGARRVTTSRKRDCARGRDRSPIYKPTMRAASLVSSIFV